MWFFLAALSATLLGFYDVAKKNSVTQNAVLPILLLNAIFSTFLFLPTILSAEFDLGWFDGSVLESSAGSFTDHLYVMLKALIVSSAWVSGFYAMKHLPITLVGPVNATRPILVLFGAVLIYGERPNLLQGSGMALAIASLYLLSHTSKKEGISFRSNKWVWLLMLSVLIGATSGLYDKYIMGFLEPVFVQSWFNVYQTAIMGLLVALIWYPKRSATTPFKWKWSIPLISIFISMADLAYYYALENADSMISVVSMVRRGSVLISFLCGALVFGERNLKAKLVDLLLIFVAMLLIYLGTV